MPLGERPAHRGASNRASPATAIHGHGQPGPRRSRSHAACRRVRLMPIYGDVGQEAACRSRSGAYLGNQGLWRRRDAWICGKLTAGSGSRQRRQNPFTGRHIEPTSFADRCCSGIHHVNTIDQHARRVVCPNPFDDCRLNAGNCQAILQHLSSRVRIRAPRTCSQFNVHTAHLPTQVWQLSLRERGATFPYSLGHEQRHDGLANAGAVTRASLVDVPICFAAISLVHRDESASAMLQCAANPMRSPALRGPFPVLVQCCCDDVTGAGTHLVIGDHHVWLGIHGNDTSISPFASMLRRTRFECAIRGLTS